jgi:uncharacterized protein (TIGR03437 family)
MTSSGANGVTSGAGRRWFAFARTSVIIGALFATSAQAGSTNVVISQIYGGGGNKGSTLKNDFIELFNSGTQPINLNGWTVQHAAATGSAWDQTPLSGMIQPGHYYLVQESQGSGGTVSLPTADAVGVININATADKIALVSNSIGLTGPGPTGPGIADFVGYGSANAAEGQPASALDNTTALIRGSGGCTDTNNNRNDFTTGDPNPRNSGSPTNPCSSSITPPIGPQTSPDSVLNSATFAAGPIAPGEIVTIFGSGLGPTQLVTLQLAPDGQHVASLLAGTRVLFDGLPAPVIFTSAGQIAVVTPFALANRSSTMLQVEFNGQTSTPIPLSVTAASPGVFTSDASGSGPAAVLNQDYSLNTAATPAAAGSIILVYATGSGQTLPVGDDGLVIGGEPLPAPLQSVSARIADIDAEVTYAGDAPGLVSGVLQVNLKIPSGTAAGSLPLVLQIGATPSQSGVTVWVKP